MTDAAALPPGWPLGVGRVVLAETGSTNAEALRHARGLSAPVWIMARRQTAGRGRRGRGWEGGEGNFSASLALPDAGSPADAARLTFVAALAVEEALAAILGPRADLAIKWPNDVLLGGAKISGILLESASSGPQVTALAVGIGVNLASAPPVETLEEGAMPPTSLRDATGDSLGPEDFLDLLAPAFARWQARLAGEGFAPIREAWLARAARLGQTITARTPRQTRIGRFDGIDAEGALILTTETGREVIPAADIHF